MKITCQSCNSKYNVADEKVQGKTVKIRCRKCGSTIVVHGAASASANGSAPVPETAPPPIRKEDAQWHVNVADNDQRTMSLAELVDAFQTGLVNTDTFVWTEGMDDWKVLSEVEAVVGASRKAPATDAVAGAAHAVDVSSRTQTAPTAEASNSVGNASEVPTAELTREPAGAYGVPFAGEAIAAGTPEPRRAAVVKREARARDLFGTNVGEDMQTNAQAAAALLAPPAPLEDGRLTGQRNENSVLFSLEVLTKSAEQRAPQEKSSIKDDSGIIDLKALAAKAESMRPALAMPQHDTFAAPLAMASPPFAPFGGVGAQATEDTPKSRLPLLIGSGAGIALLLVLGIVIGMRMGTTSPGSPSGSAAASPAQPAAEPSAVASTTAAEPATGSTAAPPPANVAPTAGAGAAAKQHAGVAPSGAVAHVAAAGPKPSTAGGAAGGGPAGGASQTAPPKKGGDCGCNGDLMCLMKCSTSH